MEFVLAESLDRLWTDNMILDATTFHWRQNVRGTTVLLWLTVIMEMQHIFPKNNVHLRMKSTCLCIFLISVSIVSANFLKANSYHPRNICYCFLWLPFLGPLSKDTTTLLSKHILMTRHNSVTLTAFFKIFQYLMTYCHSLNKTVEQIRKQFVPNLQKQPQTT